MNMEIADIQKQNTQRLVVLTGAPRSGTSLLGRLLATLEGIDYHYEPPMVWMVSALLSMGRLEPDVATMLLRVYLHEDLLCESVAGRKANLRPNDESLVLDAIGWKELVKRWSSVRNRADALDYIRGHRLVPAVKMPSIVDSVAFLANAFPESRTVLIMRDGREVVRSILRKGWFTDEGIESNYWPHKVVDGRKMPHLVADADAGRWLAMNPASRACYLWRRDAELAAGLRRTMAPERLYLLRYEDLLSRPAETMRALAQFLGSGLTRLTELGLMEVRPPGAMPDAGVLADVDATELARFLAQQDEWGYR